jgi:predicted DNA-binding transcriptional regulator YafY
MKTEQAVVYYKPNQRRLLALDQCLRKDPTKGISRENIITSLKNQGYDASLRTFARDIAKLRELKAPIAYKPVPDELGHDTVRWYYSDPSWTLSSIKITDGNLFYLLIAQKILEQYSGLPVAKHLSKAFDEITEALNRKVTVSHDMLLPISFSPEKTTPVDANIWNEVIRATVKHLHLQITYDKGWKSEGQTSLSTRTVEPYHIVNLQGTWYLLASASDSNREIRQYALTRIKAAKVLNKAFEVPLDFNVQKILNVTFGQFIGNPDDEVEICVRINKRVAHLAMERQFSALEKKTTLSNGDVKISFPATSSGPWPFYHIKSWILSWGADIEVIAPEELKRIVAEEVSKMSSRHLSQPFPLT